MQKLEDLLRSALKLDHVNAAVGGRLEVWSKVRAWTFGLLRMPE